MALELRRAWVPVDADGIHEVEPSRPGPAKDTPFDAIVVGSGFGGALAGSTRG